MRHNNSVYNKRKKEVTVRKTRTSKAKGKIKKQECLKTPSFTKGICLSVCLTRDIKIRREINRNFRIVQKLCNQIEALPICLISRDIKLLTSQIQARLTDVEGQVHIIIEETESGSESNAGLELGSMSTHLGHGQAQSANLKAVTTFGRPGSKLYYRI